MGWPQITYIVLLSLGVGHAIAKHDEPHANYNALTAMFGALIAIGLLYAGGFFSGVSQ